MRFSNLEICFIVFFLTMGLILTGFCFYRSLEGTFSVFIFVIMFIYSTIGMVLNAHKINYFDGLTSNKPAMERDFMITRILAQVSAILSCVFPFFIYFEKR